jgi:hypothetical protein
VFALVISARALKSLISFLGYSWARDAEGTPRIPVGIFRIVIPLYQCAGEWPFVIYPDNAKQVRLDLGTKVREFRVLDGADVAIAGVIDEHVEAVARLSLRPWTTTSTPSAAKSFWTWLETAQRDFKIVAQARDVTYLDEQVHAKFAASIDKDRLKEKLGLASINVVTRPKVHVVSESPAKPWARRWNQPPPATANQRTKRVCAWNSHPDAGHPTGRA